MVVYIIYRKLSRGLKIPQSQVRYSLDICLLAAPNFQASNKKRGKRSFACPRQASDVAWSQMTTIRAFIAYLFQSGLGAVGQRAYLLHIVTRLVCQRGMGTVVALLVWRSCRHLDVAQYRTAVHFPVLSTPQLVFSVVCSMCLTDYLCCRAVSQQFAAIRSAFHKGDKLKALSPHSLIFTISSVWGLAS